MTHTDPAKSHSKLLDIVARNPGCGCYRCGMIVQAEIRRRRNSAFVVKGCIVCAVCRREMRTVVMLKRQLHKLKNGLQRRIDGHRTYGPFPPKHYGPWIPSDWILSPRTRRNPATFVPVSVSESPPVAPTDATPATGQPVALKKAMMAENPHCLNCGKKLHLNPKGDVNMLARLIRGPQKLACRKCSGLIASKFHAERTEGSAAA